MNASQTAAPRTALPRTALLLIGSAKPAGQSTSEAIGSYLAARLQEHGVTTETMHVARALRTEARTAALVAAVDAADILILAFPLYVDSLPYLVTRALEQIAAASSERPADRPGLFLSIANCGFPEAAHNATALAICRQFADAAGLAWAGGLAFGAGGALAGRPLAEAGGMAHRLRAGLDLVAAALAAGQPAPDEAIALMAQPMMPARLYTLIGDVSWLQAAAHNHTLTRIGARPFAETA